MRKKTSDLSKFAGSEAGSSPEETLSQIGTSLRQRLQAVFDEKPLAEYMIEELRRLKPLIQGTMNVTGANIPKLYTSFSEYRKRPFFNTPMWSEDVAAAVKTITGKRVKSFEMDREIPYYDHELKQNAVLKLSAVTQFRHRKESKYRMRFSLIEQFVENADSNDPKKRRVLNCQSEAKCPDEVYDIRHPIFMMDKGLKAILENPSLGQEKKTSERDAFRRDAQAMHQLLDFICWINIHDHLHATVGRIWWETDEHPPSFDRFYTELHGGRPIATTPSGPIPNEEMLAQLTNKMGALQMFEHHPEIKAGYMEAIQAYFITLERWHTNMRKYHGNTDMVEDAYQILGEFAMQRVFSYLDRNDPDLLHAATQLANPPNNLPYLRELVQKPREHYVEELMKLNEIPVASLRGRTDDGVRPADYMREFSNAMRPVDKEIHKRQLFRRVVSKTHDLAFDVACPYSWKDRNGIGHRDLKQAIDDKTKER